jgi:hypothetical protein
MSIETMRKLLAPRMSAYDNPRAYAKRLRWRRALDRSRLAGDLAMIGAALILGACIAVVVIAKLGV